MELISVSATRRDLYVLLVENEQRAVKIRPRCMIDPWRGATVGSFADWIGSDGEVPRQMDQSLFESDVPIELGVEIRRIEEQAEPISERLG
jgi:hypothetical protein